MAGFGAVLWISGAIVAQFIELRHGGSGQTGFCTDPVE
jgi:hypothetical protein